MKPDRVRALFFSPTGGTRRIALQIAKALASRLAVPWDWVDFTNLQARQKLYSFPQNELAVIASPVYAGRLPNKLLPDFSEKLRGAGTPAVSLCAFGNRSCGQALEELSALLEAGGFQPVGAAAFVSRHAFSPKIGAGRPDENDLVQMEDFAARLAEKLSGPAGCAPLDFYRQPLGPYYTPLKTDGTPARFLKAKPVTDPAACLHCGLCAQVCPMGSIHPETHLAQGLCIKCQACVRRCPTGAKFFDDPDFLSHVTMLEENFLTPTENWVIL